MRRPRPADRHGDHRRARVAQPAEAPRLKRGQCAFESRRGQREAVEERPSSPLCHSGDRRFKSGQPRSPWSWDGGAAGEARQSVKLAPSGSEGSNPSRPTFAVRFSGRCRRGQTEPSAKRLRVTPPRVRIPVSPLLSRCSHGALAELARHLSRKQARARRPWRFESSTLRWLSGIIMERWPSGKAAAWKAATPPGVAGSIPARSSFPVGRHERGPVSLWSVGRIGKAPALKAGTGFPAPGGSSPPRSADYYGTVAER